MGPAAKDKDAIRKVIDSLMPTVKGLEIKILNTAPTATSCSTNASIFRISAAAGGMELPVAGVFELNGGKDREAARLLRYRDGHQADGLK
jgi:hypothetical protein